MRAQTIGLREETFDRVNARKRDDESVTNLVEWLLEEAIVDWREVIGTLESNGPSKMSLPDEQAVHTTLAGYVGARNPDETTRDDGS